MITILKFVFASLLVLLFTTCKKYPENTIWFKNPVNIPFMEGNMTHYIVNGIDSISYLDNYFYDDIFNNPYTHQFSDVKIVSQEQAKGIYRLVFYSPDDYKSSHQIIDGIQFSYKEKGKKIKISGTQTILSTFKKNIFVSDDIVWEIIYLSKKNNKRKMKGNYNGNVYEIQFN